MRKASLLMIALVFLISLAPSLCFAQTAAPFTPGFNYGPIQPISPTVAVNRFQALAADVVNASASIIVPLAMMCMIVSCIILIFGGVTGARTIKMVGWGGLWTSIAGLFVFYGIPLIIGTIHVVVLKLST